MEIGRNFRHRSFDLRGLTKTSRSFRNSKPDERQGNQAVAFAFALLTERGL